ncbi:uncharacterized protein [Macrobrachium rosenbergii]|uniref:uncharacterized protein n=1 Tax=Macrobrachium rosenbergii TaxID=79674 RepID=UPI0034D54C92
MLEISSARQRSLDCALGTRTWHMAGHDTHSGIGPFILYTERKNWYEETCTHCQGKKKKESTVLNCTAKQPNGEDTNAMHPHMKKAEGTMDGVTEKSMGSPPSPSSSPRYLR